MTLKRSYTFPSYDVVRRARTQRLLDSYVDFISFIQDSLLSSTMKSIHTFKMMQENENEKKSKSGERGKK